MISKSKIYTLDDVLASYDYGKISYFLDEFIKLREELDLEINHMIEHPSKNFEAEFQILKGIEIEIITLTKNITTFRDAMVVHEHRINEFRLIGDVKCRICIN